MFINQLQAAIADKNLLNHPFYNLWSEGKLNQEILADYSRQYYHHVNAFPCYISLLHSLCGQLSSQIDASNEDNKIILENLKKDRQILFGNLTEEEAGPENHPTLWKNFASELGVDSETIDEAVKYENTKNLVNSFFALCKQSYAAGLGALYSYEYQIPEIAEAKIQGLKDFYQLKTEKALKFFEVHKVADQWHSQEVADMINRLPQALQQQALDGAVAAACALWKFLDGMMEAHNLKDLKCQSYN
jgi:pyrroloquinoline-quinone synthase